MSTTANYGATDAEEAARTSATILSNGTAGQRRLATDLIIWTAQDEPSSKLPPQWLDGTEEGRKATAEALCQHTAPEDREPVARVLTSLLRRVIEDGPTPPGHAGETLTTEVSRHLAVITREMAEGMREGGIDGAHKVENDLQELLAMHLLISRFPKHGQCAGNPRVMKLVETAWQDEAEHIPHEPAVRRERQHSEDAEPQVRDHIPLQGFKYLALNASDTDSIFKNMNQIAGTMILDLETATAVALGMQTKRPDRNATLLVQPYLIVESPENLTEPKLATNVAAINCGIRHATAIWPRITHQEFVDA